MRAGVLWCVLEGRVGNLTHGSTAWNRADPEDMLDERGRKDNPQN